MTRPAWMQAAACNGRTALMYPVDARGQAVAGHICRSCPVVAECLEHALATDERWGTWGGTSEHERRRIRSRRRRVA